MRADLVLAAHQLDDVDKVERALLLALAICCNEKSGQCNPALETLVKHTGWGRSTLSPAIARLKKRKLISVRRTRSSMHFELHIEPRGPGDGYLGDGPQRSSGRTVKIQEADRQDPGAGYKVKKGSDEEKLRSEMATATGHRTRRPAAASWSGARTLGEKVDALLTARPELFIRDGRPPDVAFLANQINQRDGRASEPTASQLQAVARCVEAWSNRRRTSSKHAAAVAERQEATAESGG